MRITAVTHNGSLIKNYFIKKYTVFEELGAQILRDVSNYENDDFTKF